MKFSHNVLHEGAREELIGYETTEGSINDEHDGKLSEGYWEKLGKVRTRLVLQASYSCSLSREIDGFLRHNRFNQFSEAGSIILPSMLIWIKYF
jgi:hypothetical protein